MKRSLVMGNLEMDEWAMMIRRLDELRAQALAVGRVRLFVYLNILFGGVFVKVALENNKGNVVCARCIANKGFDISDKVSGEIGRGSTG